MNKTGNPVGSKAFLDFEDNVEILDVRLTSDEDTFQDRLGKSRLTWAGIEKAGTGDAGIIVPVVQQAVQDVIDGVDGAVGRAEGAAGRAEAAENNAFINANVYATVAEGLAAVAVGEQFQVVEGDDNVRYRKDSTTVATEVARYPSLVSVSATEEISNAVSGLLADGAYRNLAGVPRLGYRIDIPSQTFTKNIARNQVTYLVAVKANTPYSLVRSEDSVLISMVTLMEFDTVPVPGTPGRVLNPQTPTIITQTGHITEFSTGPTARFVVYQHSISHLDSTPLELVEGLPSQAIRSEVTFAGNVAGKNLVRGKNLYDGASVASILRDDGTWNTATTGISYYAPIEPGKTYTVTLDGNDRSSCHLTYSEPFQYPGSGGRHVRVVRSQVDPVVSVITFTAEEKENFVLIFVHSDRSAANVFMQLEEGESSTSLETPGYKLKEAEPWPIIPQDETSYGVGNANYISGGAAWADSAHTIPATDDTDSLQWALDNNSVVELEAHKKYLITRPLQLHPARTHIFDGRLAMLVTSGDFPAVVAEGSLTGSANPNSSGGQVFNEFGAILTRIKTYPTVRGEGAGIVLRKTFGVKVSECDLTYMSRGLVLSGRNRNVMVWGNNIYANSDYGIHFEPMGDLHQINIFGNHISYSRKNIFSENHSLFNIQITGNDLETSSYPENAECCIHFLHTTEWLEDLEIVGNTIEDHHNTQKMIVLEGMPAAPLVSGRISCVTIAGNVTGNSGGAEIQIGGAAGVDISGQFKKSHGYTLDVIGNINGLKMSVQSVKQGDPGGGLFRAVGPYTLSNLKVSECQLSGDVNANPILVDVDALNNCDFSGNTYRMNGLSAVDLGKGLIHVEANRMEMVRVDANTINNTAAATVTDAIKVVSGTSIKGSMVGNMARSGGFSAPESFTVSGNT